MQKTIKIDGKDVGFKASALIPRIYRHKMGRDMISDMNKLRKAYKKALEIPEDATEEEKQEAQISAIDLEIFENVAWVMAKHFNAEVEETPEEWLDTFETFSIYQILPHILELWALNNAQTSTPKKG